MTGSVWNANDKPDQDVTQYSCFIISMWTTSYINLLVFHCDINHVLSCIPS